MNISTWQAQGRELAHEHNTASPWRIADWLLLGERVGADSKYKHAALILGWSPAACRVSACVGRAFASADRYVNLTFGHHAAVASLEPEQRRQLLSAAVTEKLSVSKLRATVRALKGVEKKDPVKKPPTLIVGTTVNVKGKDYRIVKVDDGVHACSTGWLSLKLEEVTEPEPEPSTPEPPPLRDPSPDDFVPAGTVLVTPPLFDDPTHADAVTCRAELDALEMKRKLGRCAKDGCPYKILRGTEHCQYHQLKKEGQTEQEHEEELRASIYRRKTTDNNLAGKTFNAHLLAHEPYDKGIHDGSIIWLVENLKTGKAEQWRTCDLTRFERDGRSNNGTLGRGHRWAYGHFWSEGMVRAAQERLADIKTGSAPVTLETFVRECRESDAEEKADIDANHCFSEHSALTATEFADVLTKKMPEGSIRQRACADYRAAHPEAADWSNTRVYRLACPQAVSA